MFLALHRAQMSIPTQAATDLLNHYQAMLSKPGVVPYNYVQVLTGLERHGVCASAIDLQPIVGALVQRCKGQKDKLAGVLKSLKAMGYDNQQHLQQLLEIKIIYRLQIYLI